MLYRRSLPKEVLSMQYSPNERAGMIEYRSDQERAVLLQGRNPFHASLLNELNWSVANFYSSDPGPGLSYSDTNHKVEGRTSITCEPHGFLDAYNLRVPARFSPVSDLERGLSSASDYKAWPKDCPS
jgi:hypothetical protein